MCRRLWWLPGFFENRLESGNLLCSATGATKTPLCVLQLCFNSFALSLFNELGIHSSWEAKQRDTPVLCMHSCIPYCIWGWSICQSFGALLKPHDTWQTRVSQTIRRSKFRYFTIKLFAISYKLGFGSGTRELIDAQF